MNLNKIKTSALIICLCCLCLFSAKAQGDSDAILSRRIDSPIEPSRRPVSFPPSIGFRKIKESTKTGKNLLKPDEKDYAENKEFLDKSKTRIAKLFPDLKCSKYLIEIGNVPCLQVFQMVGQGAYYSFRYKSNMETAMSEIGFQKGEFFVLDFFSPKFKLLGFFTDLGDFPIESLDKNSTQLANLKNYHLPKTNAELISEKAKLTEGVRLGNDTLNSKTKVKLNNTYGLRLVNWTDGYYGGEDNDLLIALRVVRANEDGSLVFIWREIQRKGSPKLRKQ